MPYQFTVDGDPKGQPRVRATVVGKHARLYTPANAADFKDRIRSAGKEAGLRGKLLSGPLRVSWTAYFSRPKKHYRTGKNSHLLRDDAPSWHTAKPDRDNIDKAILDALTNIGVWDKDDAQICSGTLDKKYTDGIARTEIEISCLS